MATKKQPSKRKDADSKTRPARARRSGDDVEPENASDQTDALGRTSRFRSHDGEGDERDRRTTG
jgi:hypothetical protein